MLQGGACQAIVVYASAAPKSENLSLRILMLFVSFPSYLLMSSATSAVTALAADEVQRFHVELPLYSCSQKSVQP